jgi:hypothetical protein
LEAISPVVAIERKCPNNNGPCYSLSIGSEGTVEYIGINKVKTLGKQHSRIKKEETKDLADIAISIYFFSLRDKYGDTEKYPNSCQTSISISLENRHKKITYLNDSWVPRDLVWLVKKIETITNASQWIGSV